MVRHEIPGAGARSSSAAYGSFGIGRQSPAGLTQTSRSVMKGTRASFIEPMLCLATSSLPEGEALQYELKLDGYRALAIKRGGKVQLRSRNNKDFSNRYSAATKTLQKMPDETVIDGEVMAFGASGRPSFNTLQNYGSRGRTDFLLRVRSSSAISQDLRSEPLHIRRELLRTRVLSKLVEPVRYSPELDASLSDLIQSVREQKFEGLIAKRLDSRYEFGERTGTWLKMRVNQGQEFVIGGYTPGPRNFDALIFGYYEGNNLRYVVRTRNGFTPPLRAQILKRFRGLETPECPFANLPETHSGRWGMGLTAAEMKECRWLSARARRPIRVCRMDAGRSPVTFAAFREDKDPKDVRRENWLL